MVTRLNDDLALELVEVKNSAMELNLAIEQHNFLPDDFPKEQIYNLLDSLRGLHEGSLDGARIPLEHASVRISEVRRRNFLHPDNEIDTAGEEKLPILERGDVLDRKFSALLSAISTALDAYREQSRSEYESLSAGEYIELVPGISTKTDNISRIKKQILEINELKKFAKEEQWAENNLVSDVAISAADARNSLISAEAEASSSFIIRGWLKKLASNSASALNALRKSIDTIGVAGGVSYEFYLKYKSTVSNIRNVVVKEAQDWLQFISQQLDKAEKNLKEIAEDRSTKNYGIVRSMGGQKLVVTHDDIPFAISQNEVSVPKTGTMVEFDIDSSNGRPIASNIIQTSRYVIVYRELHTPQSARGHILKMVEDIVRRSKRPSVPVDFIQKKVTVKGAGSLPIDFWKILGYNSIGAFLNSSENLYGFPQTEDVQYISLKPFSFEKITKEFVKKWMIEILSKKAEPIPLSELAAKASEHFSRGAFPIRVLLGMKRFSDIFDDDSRFIISNGNVTLSQEQQFETFA